MSDWQYYAFCNRIAEIRARMAMLAKKRRDEDINTLALTISLWPFVNLEKVMETWKRRWWWNA